MPLVNHVASAVSPQATPYQPTPPHQVMTAEMSPLVAIGQNKVCLRNINNQGSDWLFTGTVCITEESRAYIDPDCGGHLVRMAYRIFKRWGVGGPKTMIRVGDRVAFLLAERTNSEGELKALMVRYLLPEWDPRLQLPGVHASSHHVDPNVYPAAAFLPANEPQVVYPTVSSQGLRVTATPWGEIDTESQLESITGPFDPQGAVTSAMQDNKRWDASKEESNKMTNGLPLSLVVGETTPTSSPITMASIDVSSGSADMHVKYEQLPTTSRESWPSRSQTPPCPQSRMVSSRRASWPSTSAVDTEQVCSVLSTPMEVQPQDHFGKTESLLMTTNTGAGPIYESPKCESPKYESPKWRYELYSEDGWFNPKMLCN